MSGGFSQFKAPAAPIRYDRTDQDRLRRQIEQTFAQFSNLSSLEVSADLVVGEDLFVSGEVFIGPTPGAATAGYQSLVVKGGSGGLLDLTDSSGTVRATISTDNTSGNALFIDTRTNHPIVFRANNTEYLRLASNGGMLLDQQSGNVEHFRLLGTSAVAHGMTGIMATAVYYQLQKFEAAGGILVRAANGGNTDARAYMVQVFANATSTARNTGARGAMVFDGNLISGTGSASLGADKNLVTFSDAGTTRFILDTDGDSHQDVGTAWTNFDTHDDIKLLNLLAAHVARRDDPLRENFSQWLQENRDELEQVRLVRFNDDGHHFVNMSRLTMLHTGALRQIGAKLAAAMERIEVLSQKLLPRPA